jgi:hypothetical protein
MLLVPLNVNMKKLILILLIIGTASFGFFLYCHPIILKAATGSTKVLSPPLNTTVRVNGVIQPSSLCFEMKSLYDGSPADRLVLWQKDTSNSYDLVIIDKLQGDVGFPVSVGDMFSDSLLNRYLFLTEEATRTVSITSEKGFAQDPKLEVSEKYIRFRIPKSPRFEEQIIEIIFDSV